MAKVRIGLIGCGFVAELQILIGAWRAFPVFTLLAGVGIIIGVAYTLRVLQKSFFGEPDKAHGPDATHVPHLEPISFPEKIGGIVLMGTSLLVGLCPRLLLDLIVPSFNTPLFSGMRKAGLL